MRHFADNLILARMEAEEEEGKEALTGFDEDRIVQTLADIFFGNICNYFDKIYVSVLCLLFLEFSSAAIKNHI
jgi:hypothetical protein